MKYTIDLGPGWSRPMTKAKLHRFFCMNCRDYGSGFSDWLGDMVRQGLIRRKTI